MTPTEEPGLVSVIIPAFNGEAYIEETIRSALNQTYSNLEVIVADDGSTDGTRPVLEDLASKDSRLRIVEGDHSGHPGVVRNRALKQACGEYIAFLDSDDLWTLDKLADQVRRLQATRGADLCFTSTRFISESEKPASLTHSLPPGQASPGLQAPPPAETAARVFEKLLTRRRTIHTSSLIIRRRLLDAVGEFSEEFELCSAQDDDFILRAWRRGKPVGLPEVYVLARRRAQSVSARNSWKNIFALIAHAEAREPLPPGVKRRAWSAAWIVRAERGLMADGEAWRGAMIQAWRRDPLNPRRAPALMAALLPRAWARRLYGSARRRVVPSSD